MEKTYYPKGSELEANWLLVDANGQGLGRMATQIANYLMGKHKAIFTPGVEVGDYVVVINASRISFTQKRLDEKMYYRHSGYPGGLKTINLRDLIQKDPERVVRQAVWGMIPHNKIGRRLLKKLKVYAGNEHPHEAQKPQPVIENS